MPFAVHVSLNAIILFGHHLVRLSVEFPLLWTLHCLRAHFLELHLYVLMTLNKIADSVSLLCNGVVVILVIYTLVFCRLSDMTR